MMLVWVSVCVWYCTAGQNAPETGMHTYTEGQSVGRHSPLHLTVGIEALRFIPKRLVILVGLLQFDNNTLTTLDWTAID